MRRNTPADIWRQVKVGTADECWHWLGYVSKHNGYGQASRDGKTVRVHRWVYELYHGVTLSPDIFLLHSCDLRHCCNPHHMREGDHAANMQDAVERKRMYRGRVPWIEAHAAAGVTPKVFRRRVHRFGWSEQEALTTPLLPTGVARGQTIRKR